MSAYVYHYCANVEGCLADGIILVDEMVSDVDKYLLLKELIKRRFINLSGREIVVTSLSFLHQVERPEPETSDEDAYA